MTTPQKIPAQNGKFVIKIVTPRGVTGYCASDVEPKALAGLLAKLKRRQQQLRRRPPPAKG